MSKKIADSGSPVERIVVFQEKSIRRTWHNNEWWFAIVDVVAVLTDSIDSKQYIKKMRSRDPMLDANWGTTCTPPSVTGAGRDIEGKQLRQYRGPVPHHPVHPFAQG